MLGKLLNNITHYWNRYTEVLVDGLKPLRDLVFANNGTSDVLRQLSCFHHCVKEAGNNVAFNFSVLSSSCFMLIIVLLFCCSVSNMRDQICFTWFLFFFIGANNTDQDRNFKITMCMLSCCKCIHKAKKLSFLRGSLTFSVKPRTLMASLTWWWIFFCISSSHTHIPRLHTAMHLNDRIIMHVFENNITAELFCTNKLF